MTRQNVVNGIILFSHIFHLILSVYYIRGKGKGKGKDVPLLLLTEHHAMKAYWGSGGTATIIL